MARSFKLPWGKRIGMLLRKSPISKIVDAMNKCYWYGIEIDEDLMETHHLAGGSIDEFVSGLIFVHEHGMTVSNDMLSMRQLTITTPLTKHLQNYLDRGITDLTEDNLFLDFPE